MKTSKWNYCMLFKQIYPKLWSLPHSQYKIIFEQPYAFFTLNCQNIICIFTPNLHQTFQGLQSSHLVNRCAFLSADKEEDMDQRTMAKGICICPKTFPFMVHADQPQTFKLANTFHKHSILGHFVRSDCLTRKQTTEKERPFPPCLCFSRYLWSNILFTAF